jgi:hypothetical protein
MLGRLFTDHPRALGLTWFEHGSGALKIGCQLIAAGFAALVHGIVPGFFTDTAGRRVIETYNYIQKIRAGSGKPEQWSDYDI